MRVAAVFLRDENRDFNKMNIGDMEALVRRDRNHPVRANHNTILFDLERR